MRPTQDLPSHGRPPGRPAASLCAARHHILLAPLLLILLLPAPLPAAETLADAWRQALAVDFRLSAATAESDASRASLAAARGLALPKASASSAYTVLNREPAARIGLPALPGVSLPDQLPLSERTYATHALQASLPVYTGGRITAAIAAADAGLRASGQEQRRTEQAVKLDVAEAWINVLRARQAASAAQSHLTALEAHAADVDQLARQGLAARSDVLSVAVARADALQHATQAGHAVTLAAAAYNRLLGRPFEHTIELAEPPPPDSARPALASLIAQAREQRPEMALLGAHAEATDREADMERAGARPQVALSGALVHEDNRYRVGQDMAQVAIGMQWELFDGGVRTARVDAAAARARAIRDRQADAASLIELEVHREWLAVEDAGQRLGTASAAVAQADENLRVARDRYRNGVGTHTEVLDAEALRSLSERNHLNAHYDLHLARYRLRKAVGDL